MLHGAYKPRYALYQWLLYFLLTNILLALLISLRYLSFLPDFHTIPHTTVGGIALGCFFLGSAFMAQVILLYALPGLVLLGLIVLCPRRGLVFASAIFLAALSLFILIADCIAFELYHMHYAGVAWSIFKAGAVKEVILLSWSERWMLLLMVTAFLVIEYGLAVFLWRRLRYIKVMRYAHSAGLLCLLLGLFSYGLLHAAEAGSWLKLRAGNKQIIIKMAHLAPYYFNIYHEVMPQHTSMRHILIDNTMQVIQVDQPNDPLRYPLHPLHCETPQQLKNILIIGIDTWRYDGFSPTISPNIYQFSKRAMQFQSHWSGGNCTKTGLTSLFYGLPANYWEAFLKQRRGPVLIQQLLQHHYQLGIFASAPLTFPEFNHTIFSDIPKLIRIQGTSSLQRDHAITTYFQNFLKHRNKTRPFFSFLFYDAVHNYCESKTPEQQPFQPAVSDCNRMALTAAVDPLPYMNRYRNTIYFVDHEIKQVLATLKTAGVLDKTVVIITSDHGEQLNDARMGYWDHASAYTPYQLHVPLLIYWPGRAPHQYGYFTSHYDIVPTLMQGIFGCHDRVENYTVGKSLFSAGGRPFLIAGSYADYAIIMPTGVMRVYPDGDYTLNNLQGHVVRRIAIKPKMFTQVLQVLTQYFHPQSGGGS